MSYVPSFFVVHLPIERRSEETNKILPIGVRPCLVERGYGVSAFNVKNIEQINAIVDASHAKTERAYDSAVSAGGVSNIVTKSQSVATIVFDLDGTLVDTAPDLVDALNFTLTQNGLSAISHGEARALIGSGMRSMIERALIFATANSRRAEVDTLYRRFLAHYGEHIAERSRPFPGVAVELDRLSACGYRLAVCTNKLESLSRRLLGALELSDRFATICGQDTFGLQKPDPRMLRETVTRAGGEPARAIMVGDSITDIRIARAANVPIVAVDFGYTDVPIAALNPNRVISSFAELSAAIASLE